MDVVIIQVGSGPPTRSPIAETVGAAPSEFVLLGDEWQLDARVIRWTLPGQLAGLPPVYRFERLSGRYGDPKQELAVVFMSQAPGKTRYHYRKLLPKLVNEAIIH